VAPCKFGSSHTAHGTSSTAIRRDRSNDTHRVTVSPGQSQDVQWANGACGSTSSLAEYRRYEHRSNLRQAWTCACEAITGRLGAWSPADRRAVLPQTTRHLSGSGRRLVGPAAREKLNADSSMGNGEIFSSRRAAEKYPRPHCPAREPAGGPVARMATGGPVPARRPLL
jgi:hypothetical protein